MFKRILIGTDLSEASSKVIGQMDFFYCLGATEAVLVYCVNVRDVGYLTDALKESLREILGRRIEPGELKPAIEAGMAEALQAELVTAELSAREWALAREIAADRTVMEEGHGECENSSAGLV